MPAWWEKSGATLLEPEEVLRRAKAEGRIPTETRAIERATYTPGRLQTLDTPIDRTAFTDDAETVALAVVTAICRACRVPRVPRVRVFDGDNLPDPVRRAQRPGEWVNGLFQPDFGAAGEIFVRRDRSLMRVAGTAAHEGTHAFQQSRLPAGHYLSPGSHYHELMADNGARDFESWLDSAYGILDCRMHEPLLVRWAKGVLSGAKLPEWIPPKHWL